MKILTKLMLILAQLGMVGAAQAGTISLSPVSRSVTAGETVSFDVVVDFRTTPTIGGYFKLDYSASTSLLSSASFTPNAIFGPVVNTPISSVGYLNGMGFVGTFSGQGTLGTVTFSTSTVGAGNAQISLLFYPDEFPAVSPETFYNFRNSGATSFIDMEYNGATVEVSAVPVPAALWLMASGLSALGLGMRRRRA